MPLAHQRRSLPGGAGQPIPFPASLTENIKYRERAGTRETYGGPVFMDDGIHTTGIGQAVDVAAVRRPQWDPTTKRWVRAGQITDHQEFINWYITDTPLNRPRVPGASASEAALPAPVMQSGREVAGPAIKAREMTRSQQNSGSTRAIAQGNTKRIKGRPSRGAASRTGTESTTPSLPPLAGASPVGSRGVSTSP
eukprot:Hpha_TRINITY_DN8883_c0_g1::TRINITY_DN8883_c0_g1_i1::g.141575::m.141575